MADQTQYTRRPFSCAQSAVKINGIIIGWATDVSFEETFAQFPIEVLNDAYAQTFEITNVRVSGTFGKFRIYLEPLSQAAGDNAIWYDQNLDTPQLIRFTEKMVTLCDGALENSPPLLTVIGMKPTSRRISVATGSVMIENCSFVARKLIETKSMQVVPLG